MTRVGIGYDIHRLVENRRLLIGGVEIPYIKGLLGHSDGDALLHAVCDAILGAAAEKDIGEHFPDTDSAYQGIDSSKLLSSVVSLMIKKGYRIINIDTVVIAEAPVLIPFKKKIQQHIAQITGLPETAVSVKAKTNEGIGGIGRKEAIAAYAVVSLEGGA